jgi:N utilization substance protein B
MLLVQSAVFITVKKFLILKLKKVKNPLKTKTDPRHRKRRETVCSLFSYLFNKQKEIDSDLKPIIDNLEKIDLAITSSAPEWPLERINKIDLSILRLAVFELLVQRKEPPKVIIDEAVELGKEFGSETSSSFVNGVLGDILKKNETTNSN